jgi:hypothetical protein
VRLLSVLFRRRRGALPVICPRLNPASISRSPITGSAFTNHPTDVERECSCKPSPERRRR